MVAFDFESLQIVSVLEVDALLTPDAAGPWASPCVTLWKFSFTSPSEPEMWTTPGLVERPPPEWAPGYRVWEALCPW